MADENMLIARLEAANTTELAQLILHASVEDERVLRIHLGDERFRRLRNLVLRREMVREERRETQRMNVVLIPGMLGCELTSIDGRQNRERVWLSPNNIVAGHFDRLKLAPSGLVEASDDHQVHVTGIMKRYYGELMLSLAVHHNVYAFWYDWRKDMRLAAARLQAVIDNWFPAGEPVHLVAHAAGGLVARAYLHMFPERWKLGHSKLIMIGTPNYGVYTTPQALTGHLSLIQWIDLLDIHHYRADFREIIKSFPGLYQLLPAPTDANLKKLYQATTYGQELNVPQAYLTNARKFHRLLSEAAVDPDRMVYIAGHNQPTFVGVDADVLSNFPVSRQPDIEEEQQYIQKTYRVGLNGDGTVAHQRGVLRTKDGIHIPAYYVDALHGDACCHPQVLMAIQHLVSTAAQPPDRGAPLFGLKPMTSTVINDPREAEIDQNQNGSDPDRSANLHSRSRQTFETLVRRTNSQNDQSIVRPVMTIEEREIAERLTYGYLSGAPDSSQTTYRAISLGIPSIKINLAYADDIDITDTVLALPRGTGPVDALAVGHYSNSKPHGILRTLDYKISRALDGEAVNDGDVNLDEEIASDEASKTDDVDLMLTQYTQRGTIRADLGQTFFLNDPRDSRRTLAIAGMGEPGRFGTPELTLLVRELCWSLGRMGRKHLATVLIGVGRDNLAIADAVVAWIRGIKLAITGIARGDDNDKHGHVLEEITFFITDPRKVRDFDRVLSREMEQLHKQNRMRIAYTKLTLDPEQREVWEKKEIEYVRKQMETEVSQRASNLPVKEVAPTRITVNVEGNKYHFGAITNSASIPEREIPLDPALVRRANEELAIETNPRRQLDLGRFVQRLLIPADLRSQIGTNAPLVMMLDNQAAHIHWELLAQSNLSDTQTDEGQSEESYLRFWGTSRSFTRQLRTVHAPLPGPPPPAQRHLRVLIVADPAEDAHLFGAEQEGIAIADLFDQFNIAHAHSCTGNRVEVVQLFGPREATRTTVLRHLMMRTYDILHFAGHCAFEKDKPAESGWVFSNGELLSAHEFTRIDRSPAFVFSNACESGVTPANPEKRSVDLAPNFAESFFARGVTDFVCTAWPVEDRAARDFALTLYAGLLGLEPVVDSGVASPHLKTAYQVGTPLSMHKAMMKARQMIAKPPCDIRTWGAYQHYGNPYFRFFDPAGFGKPQPINRSAGDGHVEDAADEYGRQQPKKKPDG